MNTATDFDDDTTDRDQPTRKTNVEAITELMEFSKYGALAQMFVIDALTRHAEAVMEAPDSAFESMAGFIAPQAWRGVAKEIKEKLDLHLGGAG